MNYKKTSRKMTARNIVMLIGVLLGIQAGFVSHAMDNNNSLQSLKKEIEEEMEEDKNEIKEEKNAIEEEKEHVDKNIFHLNKLNMDIQNDYEQIYSKKEEIFKIQQESMEVLKNVFNTKPLLNLAGNDYFVAGAKTSLNNKDEWSFFKIIFDLIFADGFCYSGRNICKDFKNIVKKNKYNVPGLLGFFRNKVLWCLKKYFDQAALEYCKGGDLKYNFFEPLYSYNYGLKDVSLEKKLGAIYKKIQTAFTKMLGASNKNLNDKSKTKNDDNIVFLFLVYIKTFLMYLSCFCEEQYFKQKFESIENFFSEDSNIIGVLSQNKIVEEFYSKYHEINNILKSRYDSIAKRFNIIKSVFKDIKDIKDIKNNNVVNLEKNLYEFFSEYWYNEDWFEKKLFDLQKKFDQSYYDIKKVFCKEQVTKVNNLENKVARTSEFVFKPDKIKLDEESQKKSVLANMVDEESHFDFLNLTFDYDKREENYNKKQIFKLAEIVNAFVRDPNLIKKSDALFCKENKIETMTLAKLKDVLEQLDNISSLKKEDFLTDDIGRIFYRLVNEKEFKENVDNVLYLVNKLKTMFEKDVFEKIPLENISVMSNNLNDETIAILFELTESVLNLQNVFVNSGLFIHEILSCINKNILKEFKKEFDILEGILKNIDKEIEDFYKGSNSRRLSFDISKDSFFDLSNYLSDIVSIIVIYAASEELKAKDKERWNIFNAWKNIINDAKNSPLTEIFICLESIHVNYENYYKKSIADSVSELANYLKEMTLILKKLNSVFNDAIKNNQKTK